MLGLPDRVTACLFDLDGVLTQTAKAHAAAWKQIFDSYFGDAAFDPVVDYDRYVDGKPRNDGVRSYLALGERAAAKTIERLGDARPGSSSR